MLRVCIILTNRNRIWMRAIIVNFEMLQIDWFMLEVFVVTFQFSFRKVFVLILFIIPVLIKGPPTISDYTILTFLVILLTKLINLIRRMRSLLLDIHLSSVFGLVLIAYDATRWLDWVLLLKLWFLPWKTLITHSSRWFKPIWAILVFSKAFPNTECITT